ncbi:MAG: N-acetylmuramoyl-L-alanine amidase [Clostridia bacterium]|nr:N-acetylmuramoyl-L-alanine amidase [Clostridia bacterium]
MKFLQNRKKVLVIIIAALTLVGAVCLCLGVAFLLKFYKEPQMVPTFSTGAFVVDSPEYGEFTTEEDTVTFTGSCNVLSQLTVNGKPTVVKSDGSFSVDVKLNKGENKIVLQNDGLYYSYLITYDYALIKDAAPSSALSIESGSVMQVSVLAQKGSDVTAALFNDTITLEPNEPTNPDERFVQYTGSFTLTNTTDSNKKGAITYTATKNEESVNISSAEITLKKAPKAPMIAEVVAPFAETFNKGTSDDYSRPTNSYLPKGTVDYCNYGTIVNTSAQTSYKTLKYGKRVYEEAVILYEGTLPEHNQLNIIKQDETDRYTNITLSTIFKAPFTFEIKKQSYKNEGSRDYTFSTTTFSYIDITFSYANSLTGQLNLTQNPIFKSYKIIEKQNSYVLRLYLRKTGQFYGWTAEYDSDGNLCFSFLKPAKIKSANNEYGVSLKGVTVFVDVGHGGSDAGAVSANGKFTEASLNLKLALMLKDELESIGATVKMSRDSDKTLEQPERIALFKESKADFAVSIHRNSSPSNKVSAFNTYHYNPFTKAAADLIYESTGGLYTHTQHSGVQWHYFYMSRLTDCPFVLTENGYISNAAELLKIIDDDFNKECAKSIAKGIVDYFISIQ